jgi:hypothetical protein
MFRGIGSRLPKRNSVLGHHENPEEFEPSRTEAEAKTFLERLSEIYEDERNKSLPAISDETMLYWREGVGNAGS